MKILNLTKAIIVVLISLSFTSLVSCKKNDEKAAIVLSQDEYIYYSVNGTDYSFLKPADTVFADTLTETSTFFLASKVYGDRIPSTTADFARIVYAQTNIGLGSQQQLALFAVAQTEVYPYYATAAAPIFVHITEYGNVGEFVAGNFSGLITGAAPGNLQYNVTCNFRVKRRI